MSSVINGSLALDSFCTVDVNGVYKLTNIIYLGDKSDTMFSYDYEIDITVADTANVVNNAVINGKLRRTTGTNKWYNPNSQVATSVIETSCSISYYTQLDWTNFVVSTAIVNNSTSQIGRNNQLYIELIKLK